MRSVFLLLQQVGIGGRSGHAGLYGIGCQRVQIGSRFAASEESSAHPHFKEAIVGAGEGSTGTITFETTDTCTAYQECILSAGERRQKKQCL